MTPREAPSTKLSLYARISTLLLILNLAILFSLGMSESESFKNMGDFLFYSYPILYVNATIALYFSCRHQIPHLGVTILLIFGFMIIFPIIIAVTEALLPSDYRIQVVLMPLVDKIIFSFWAIGALGIIILASYIASLVKSALMATGRFLFVIFFGNCGAIPLLLMFFPPVFHGCDRASLESETKMLPPFGRIFVYKEHFWNSGRTITLPLKSTPFEKVILHDTGSSKYTTLHQKENLLLITGAQAIITLTGTKRGPEYFIVYNASTNELENPYRGDLSGWTPEVKLDELEK